MLRYLFANFCSVLIGVFCPHIASSAEPFQFDTSDLFCFSNVFVGDVTFEIHLSSEQSELVEKLMSEGSELQKSGAVTSLQQAKLKFEKVIQITQAAGERSSQASAWSQLGDVMLELNDPQNAQDSLPGLDSSFWPPPLRLFTLLLAGLATCGM
jgi:hypothetical protein